MLKPGKGRKGGHQALLASEADVRNESTRPPR